MNVNLFLSERASRLDTIRTTLGQSSHVMATLTVAILETRLIDLSLPAKDKLSPKALRELSGEDTVSKGTLSRASALAQSLGQAFVREHGKASLPTFIEAALSGNGSILRDVCRYMGWVVPGNPTFSDLQGLVGQKAPSVVSQSDVILKAIEKGLVGEVTPAEFLTIAHAALAAAETAAIEAVGKRQAGQDPTVKAAALALAALAKALHPGEGRGKMMDQDTETEAVSAKAKEEYALV